MNTEEHEKKFDRDGYLLIEKFFDDQLMDRMDALVRDYYGILISLVGWEGTHIF